MSPFVKKIVSQRTIIQVVIGISIYIGYAYFNISLWWLLGVGALIGLVLGKVFCRWMCPMGFIMELFMSSMGDQKYKQMYQYHKLGCPIAWVEGFSNRFSLFKINLNKDTCKNCGICDKQCYITTLEPAKYSLYIADKERPGTSFTCSKCLNCVAACPNGSLKFNVQLDKNKL